MNYDEDDELERMRLRRQLRRETRQGREGSGYRENRYDRERTGRRADEERPSHAGSQRAGRNGSQRAGQAESGPASFRSGYSGPKNGGGRSKRGKKGGRSGFRGMDRGKKILLIAGCVLLALVLFVAGAFAYVNHRIFGSMQSVDFDESKVENVDLSDEQLAQMKGHWTIACFGVDSRADKNGEMNVGKGTNADVNMICSVDLETGEIKLVSVFRDTYLNISDKNTYNKINAAYSIGGPEQAVAALNKNLDLNITQYATFNWKAVADAINILGGIDIELSENERSWINAYITETVNETGIGSHQIEKAGLVHMDGVQAVAYGRIRYGDTDYARTERQRIVLEAAFEKAKTADWATINNIIQTVMPQLATNINMADLIPLARNLTRFHIGDTRGFPMARGEANIGKYGDCVIPQTLESNVIELHQFLFGTENYQPSAKVQSYSQHISEVSGMYNEGKSIDHVPVDQGLNASSYVKAKQKRAAEKAAAEQKAREEAAAAEKENEETKSGKEKETAEETKDYFGDWDEENWSEEDWDEFWGSGNWYDDWGDDGISDDGASGPGSEASGPAGETGGSQTIKPGGGAAKPGEQGQNQGNTKPGGQEPAKPGSTLPADSGAEGPGGSSQPGPGGSDMGNQGTAKPGSGSGEFEKPGSGSSGTGGSGAGTESVSPADGSGVSPVSGGGTKAGGSGNGAAGEPVVPDPPEPEQEAAGPGAVQGPAGPAA